MPTSAQSYQYLNTQPRPTVSYGTAPGYDANGFGSGGQSAYDAVLDQSPYDRAFNRGLGFINNGIPTNANKLWASSPAFRNLGTGTKNALTTTYGNYGRGLQNQARLDLQYKRGTEPQQLLLSQMLGLAGLDAQRAGLENQYIQNDVNASTGSLSALLKLLGVVL